jgi:hypothetical protein
MAWLYNDRSEPILEHSGHRSMKGGDALIE